MSTLSEYRKKYYETSAKASDVARQLAFAGIAVVWVFKQSSTEKGPAIPAPLLVPLGFFAMALCCDLLQYVGKATIWGLFLRHKERAGNSPDSKFSVPSWINWPGNFCYVCKMTFVITAYVKLLYWFQST